MTEKIIFLGGCYSGDQAIREKIAASAKWIENIIRQCDYEPSLNLLSNENVFDKTKVTDNLYFHNQESFSEIAQKATKHISKNEIQVIRGLRAVETDEQFHIAIRAYHVAMSQLKQAFAGIFELSELSQGSFFEIATMIQIYKRPVLCLSHSDWGRPFGKMLTGCNSRLLRTESYCEKNLEEIVTKFLTVEILKYNNVTVNIRMPAYLQEKLNQLAESNKMNQSEFLRWLVQNHIDNPGFYFENIEDITGSFARENQAIREMKYREVNGENI